MTKSLYHTLKVHQIIEETHDSKSVVFERPDLPAFDYKPGQFLTLRIPTEHALIARCYSLASAPGVDEGLKVTIKRVTNGLGSNWVCDNLKAGDSLEVLAPAGVFCPKSLEVDFVLFAGGSGITPVMSILKACLQQNSGRVFLFYANRDERSVIFARELQALCQRYPTRLTVMHWLESVQGLPTHAQLQAIAQPYTHAHAFVCGPGPFMDAVESTLHALNVERNRIHVERFVSLTSDPGLLADVAEPTPNSAQTALKVQLDGQVHSFDWSDQSDLLDLLLAKGLRAPFSCREGRCSACMCRVQVGEVHMRVNEVLDASDLAEGWVLACQARPVTDKVSVSFDG